MPDKAFTHSKSAPLILALGSGKERDETEKNLQRG